CVFFFSFLIYYTQNAIPCPFIWFIYHIISNISRMLSKVDAFEASKTSIISTFSKTSKKDISEEERAARHNLEETNSFLQSVKAESERMASEVQDMSKQLEDYGYVPLPKQNETQDDTFIIWYKHKTGKC
ncbi:hypothetical protein C0J52_04708, partial [Blattella germanica]